MLDNKGRVNEKTPKSWLMWEGYLPQMTCDKQQEERDTDNPCDCD